MSYMAIDLSPAAETQGAIQQTKKNMTHSAVKAFVLTFRPLLTWIGIELTLYISFDQQKKLLVSPHLYD